MPISKENGDKFISAVSSINKKEMASSITKEPTLLREKLFGDKTVFQHLAQESSPENMKKLRFLLTIAKTKWSSAEWYGFFEDYIASCGQASVIVNLVQKQIFKVNDNGFSGQNTVLHLAAKYEHKELAKLLIVKCEAGTYLTNEDNKKAKDVAPERSGIPQLIKESIHEKVFKQMFKPKVKELNEKIESLKEENAALRKSMNKVEKSNENLKNELIKTKKYAENFEIKLNEGTEKNKSDQDKNDNRFKVIQTSHNNFVRYAEDKGFFQLKTFNSAVLNYYPQEKQKQDLGICLILSTPRINFN